MTNVPLTETDSQPAGLGDGGKYVYCIIRSDRQRDFGSIGIGGGQKVFTVAYKDLAAVVSDTPIVIYDPTRDNVLAHEFVNETVMGWRQPNSRREAATASMASSLCRGLPS